MHPAARLARLCALAATLAGLTVAPTKAQTPILPSPTTWQVQPAFAAEARNNITGANCADVQFRLCLVVNNATRFAQPFGLAGSALRPGPLVGITANRNDPAPHAEGVTHDRGFFYVVTSRGRDFTLGQPDPAFLIIRLPIDGIGGPAAPGALPTVEVSEKLREALNAGIAIPQLPGQQLTRTTADIEGIAIKDSMIHLGLRAPVLSGKAFIVSASPQAFFETPPLNPIVRVLELGPNIGIHDLATVSDGLLILAGPSREVAGGLSLFHLSDSTGQVKPVAELVEPTDRHGKGLLVFHEEPEFYRILVLFEGVPDGGPIEYLVPR
jgi:hypothetical protein